MGFSKIHRAVTVPLIFVIGVAGALLFQNCSGANVSKNPGKYFISKGNGDGYGGKLTSYVNVDLNQTCADGSNEKSKIQVNEADSKAYVVRESCRDVQAKEIALSATGLMPHNSSVLFYETRVFDRLDSGDGISQIVCRGKWWDSVRSENLAADAVVSYSPGQQGASHARVILGIYDRDWNLLETHDSSDVSVAAFAESAGHISFLSNSMSSERKMFALDIVTSTFVGTLSYILSFPEPPSDLGAVVVPAPSELPPVPQLDVSGGSNPPPGANDGGAKYIPNMQCYEQ